jgi:hypothetical protein
MAMNEDQAFQLHCQGVVGRGPVHKEYGFRIHQGYRSAERRHVVRGKQVPESDDDGVSSRAGVDDLVDIGERAFDSDPPDKESEMGEPDKSSGKGHGLCGGANDQHSVEDADP